MARVTTVSYLIRFNNCPLEPFKPTCGLLQGDPLSSYLLLFVADGFSKLLQKEIAQGSIHELQICRRAPGISHLLLADDTLLFLEATGDQATKVNRVLRSYERGTGQLINPTKCSLFFSVACTEENKETVKTILGVQNIAQEEKYLGLPTL
jgi:hypothetical protein